MMTRSGKKEREFVEGKAMEGGSGAVTRAAEEGWKKD